MLGELARQWPELITELDNLPNIFVTGRKVNKTPSNSTDVVAGTDRENDFNWDNNYLYVLVDNSGTLVWKTLPFTNFQKGQPLLQVRKTSSLTASTGYSDVTGWDEEDKVDSVYSWNETTGVLTINDTGWFSLNAWLVIDNTNTTNIESFIKLVDSSGDISGAYDHQLVSTDGTYDNGSNQISSFLYNVSSSGETIKIQHGLQGTSCDIIAVRLTVMKVG